MRHISPIAKLLAASVLPLALAACSSSSTGSGTAAPAAAAPSAAPASSAPADPNAGVLTGTQLKAMLAPASFFPAGYALDSANSRDTGDTYVTPASADVPMPDCTRLGGTSWTGITGIDGVSFAENDYINKNNSSEVAQEIDVYSATTAQTVLGAVGKLSAACPSYTDAQTSSKVTVTEKPTAGLGDGAYTLTLTSPSWKGGTTLIAARVGTSVVSVLSSSSGADKGAGTASKLITQLATALKAKA